MVAARVEMVSSLAHRRGDGIRMVLRLPHTRLDAGRAVPVRLTRVRRDGEATDPAGQTVTAAAEVTSQESGVTLELTVPVSEVEPGVWDLTAHPETGEPFLGIGARLVAVAGFPVALTPVRTPGQRRARRGRGGRQSTQPRQPAQSRSLPRRLVSSARRQLRPWVLGARRRLRERGH